MPAISGSRENPPLLQRCIWRLQPGASAWKFGDGQPMFLHGIAAQGQGRCQGLTKTGTATGSWYTAYTDYMGL
jgi:hypothetical protein